MKIVYNKEMTNEEKNILFTKVRKYKFSNYPFKRNVENIFEEYGEQNLDILYAYVKQDMDIEDDGDYGEEEKKEAIKQYASISRESLFRLQLLYSLLGSGIASIHIGKQFCSISDYESALVWFKKAIKQGEIQEAGRAILQIWYKTKGHRIKIN